MVESIYVQNLGPLKDVKIDDIRPLTVLIGDSGVGKSLLMKTISMMRYVYKRHNISRYLANSGLKSTPFRLRKESLFREELKYYFSKSDAKVTYSVSFPSGNKYEIVYANGSLKRPAKIADEDLIFFKESWVSETRNIIPSWITNPANVKSSLGFYFNETLGDFDEAITVHNRYAMDFIHGSVEVTKGAGNRKLLLRLPDLENPIELRYASSGIQTAAPLVTLTQYFAENFSFKEAKRRSVLSYLYDSDLLTQFHPQTELSEINSIINMHIEEPELSLDPEAQIRLIYDTVKYAFHRNTNKITLMFATHSPYIVNALNLIIRRKGDYSLAPDDIAVFRLFDGHLINLKAEDEKKLPIIITDDLTDPMERLYNEYLTL